MPEQEHVRCGRDSERTPAALREAATLSSTTTTTTAAICLRLRLLEHVIYVFASTGRCFCSCGDRTAAC
ncbi:uncharacterized [Tachysurus ichikawai]